MALVLCDNKKTYRKTSPKPVKRKDVPATQAFLYSVRNELKKEIANTRNDLKGDLELTNLKISAVGYELKADIAATNSRIDAVRDELKADIASLRIEAKADVARLESKIDKLSLQIHQMMIMMEEQRAQNIYVLDGYASLYDRQERLENSWNDFENKWQK